MFAPHGAPHHKLGWFFRHKTLTIALLVLLAVVLAQVDGMTDPEEAGGRSVATESTAPAPVQGRDHADSADSVGEEPARRSAKQRSKREPAPKPTQAPAPVRPRIRTYLVTRVVDGDTIELGNGEHVRVVGIDTPERGECGYDAATVNMERLVLGKRVRLTISDEDRDRYGRLLRYVNVGGLDAGLRQIDAGLAIARYDSRDGYGYHPRENRYIAADKASPNKTCPRPKPAPVQQPAGAGCAPGYDPCVPPYPPDLDCADVDGPIRVTGSDPHGLDGEGDGIACES